MDDLLRIKRLAVARRVEFTLKAEEERLRDGLSVEDVLESIVNANAIKKVLRSRSTTRLRARERLYVIESPTGHLGVYEGSDSTEEGRGGLLCLRLGEARRLRDIGRPARVRRAARGVSFPWLKMSSFA